MASGMSAMTEQSADLQHSFIIRQGRLLPVDFQRLLQGDLSQNIFLQPDDFVYLPSAVTQEVHVLGAVGQPKAIGFTGQLSLISAIARAGGTVKDAYLSHVAIVRGSITEPRIAIVDYQAIVRGQAPDVLLEPRDIVHVPPTPYKTLAKYADLVLSAFVRTVGVNEGARAVSRGAPPIGVNVPVGF
jgi:polysaccharide export outer membrane protein